MWSSSDERRENYDPTQSSELRAAYVWWTALLINFLSSNRWASPGYAHHQTHDICSDHVCSNCCAHVSDSLPSLNSTRCLSCTLTVFMFSVCAISQMDFTPCLMFFYLFLIGLQCRLQGVSELSQLLPLAVLSLFDLQRKRNSIVVFA